MGVNWNSGLLYWKDHMPNASASYSLSHLHPFVRQMELTATDKYPARVVHLHVSFGLHTFTRSVEGGSRDHDLYHDNREVRTFCPVRYAHSLELPGIIRTLETRRCEFARSTGGRVNYVTVETASGNLYAAFFDLRRLKKAGPNAVHLMVQSAYVLDPLKPSPGKGRIHSMRYSVTCCGAQSPDHRLESAFAEPRNAKPRLKRVSSVRIHLPATGADLSRGGRAPSRLSYTAVV